MTCNLSDVVGETHDTKDTVCSKKVIEHSEGTLVGMTIGAA